MDGRGRGLAGAELDGFGAPDAWYVGRPLLVTENDYELRPLQRRHRRGRRRAADGRDAGGVRARAASVLEFSPTRLGAVDTVYAMTVHKSQGSQFDTAAVLLPDAELAAS